jgi:excisionase family DNA binding protein
METLTTGQIAKICNVANRTVAKWIDMGLLKGYVIPGSKHRRVVKADLAAFVKKHGIPCKLEGSKP